MTEPLITVIIPARNEERYIDACLDSVEGQTYRNLDIVVIDGASTDATVARVNEHSGRDKRVRLATNPRGITPVSLNVGLAEARGEWLVRVDAHSTVPPEYVGIAVEHLRTNKWGGVGGRKDGIGITSAGRTIAVAMSSPFGVGNSVYHHGTGVQTVDHIPFGAYPVALARSIGGWDEKLRVNQDFEFDWRIRQSGQELLFDPRLRIDWICRQSTRDLLRQYMRYGRGKARVASMHPKSLAIRHLVPPFLVAYLVLAVYAGFVISPWVTLICFAPYLLGVLGASVLTARKLKRGDRWHLPLIFLAMHLGWGAGFYAGAMDVLVMDRLRREPT